MQGTAENLCPSATMVYVDNTWWLGSMQYYLLSACRQQHFIVHNADS